MKKINILDRHISQLIAAGEVVERPASVLKELLENSIDSGATRIVVEIRNGGVKYIKVSDNGSGIYREDVKNAFLRHATSKIKDEKDLNYINSLGFRGEALASICAVSKVELITKANDEIIGSHYFIKSGNPGLFEDIGTSNGTTVIVRDLFYNVPARMKFLKKDVSEANFCSGVIDKLVLSHPEIAFKFVREGKEVLNSPGDSKIMSAVYSVYGKEFFNGMIPITYEFKNIKVSGFVSRPNSAKSSRSSQNFFINGRYIKSKLGSSALEEAFKNSIMIGKFPYCVIYIDVSPEFVDVNVHPSKTEVKFVDEKLIFESIYYGVKSALMSEKNVLVSNSKDSVLSVKLSDVTGSSTSKHDNAINVSKNFLVKTEKSKVFENLDSLFKRSEPKNNLPGAIEIQKYPVNKINDSVPKCDKINSQDFKKGEEIVTECRSNVKKIENLNIPKSNEPTFFEVNNKKVLKVIGEIFDCYIIVQCDREIILVDKHAAHERIIFEKLKNNTLKNESQSLLEPLVITLEKEEYNAISQNTDILSKSGYVIEDFGSGSVIIRGIPMYMILSEVENSILEIANYIINNKKTITTSRLDWLYHNIACRSAIKGGKNSDLKELEELVLKLMEEPEIKYCPHGRPIFVSLSQKFIEKQFKRT